MTAKEITGELERIVLKQDFAACSAELVDVLSAAGAGIETIDPILRFMEDHPSINYGAPGALVHFLERYYRKGYEEKLVDSVRRKPTRTTVWMLNRIINGTQIIEIKRQLIEVMEAINSNPLADQITLQQAKHFLERLIT